MRRTKVLVATIVTTFLALAAFASVWTLLSDNLGLLWPSLSVAIITIIGFTFIRWLLDPDQLRARQSERILTLANESQQFLRDGLSLTTAQEVCKIILPATNAVSIAITDTEKILGFSGEGEDHHEVGGEIMTSATKKTLKDKQVRVLDSKFEIGCSDPHCKLRAAIVVPLQVSGQAVGTLKFYYLNARRINETQLAMAEGLGQLLGTQLSLAELERHKDLATRAELKALQSQINPHFLFNTINTIASLIRTDPAQARILLREFAIFYRRTLENAEDLIELNKEVEQTHRYLGFEIARFGERIAVQTDIDPDLDDLCVPAFVIQPLVENSIAHGMRPEGTLHIYIKAYRSDNEVIIEVEDDGVGITQEELSLLDADSANAGLGIALRNVEGRLKGYFGPRAGMEITSTSDGGTTVRLHLTDSDT